MLGHNISIRTRSVDDLCISNIYISFTDFSFFVAEHFDGLKTAPHQTVTLRSENFTLINTTGYIIIT